MALPAKKVRKASFSPAEIPDFTEVFDKTWAFRIANLQLPRRTLRFGKRLERSRKRRRRDRNNRDFTHIRRRRRGRGRGRRLTKNVFLFYFGNSHLFGTIQCVSVGIKTCPCSICYECFQFQIEIRNISLCGSRSPDETQKENF